jgi:hypothetical protein
MRAVYYELSVFHTRDSERGDKVKINVPIELIQIDLQLHCEDGSGLIFLILF